ncbi:hypothetical protein MOMOMM108M1_12180 [Morganella morganii]
MCWWQTNKKVLVSDQNFFYAFRQRKLMLLRFD